MSASTQPRPLTSVHSDIREFHPAILGKRILVHGYLYAYGMNTLTLIQRRVHYTYGPGITSYRHTFHRDIKSIGCRSTAQPCGQISVHIHELIYRTVSFHVEQGKGDLVLLIPLGYIRRTISPAGISPARCDSDIRTDGHFLRYSHQIRVQTIAALLNKLLHQRKSIFEP